MRRFARVWFLLFLPACFSLSKPEKSRPFLPSESPPTTFSPEQWIRRGEIDLALTELEKNLRDAESPKDLFLYGKALRMRGRAEDAQSVFEKLLSKGGYSVAALRGELAGIALEKEDYPEAVRRLRELGPAKEDQALLTFLENFRGKPHAILEGQSASIRFAGGEVPRVPVRLEGHADATLIVDTGASFSVLSVSLAKKIGLFQRVEGGILIDLEGKPLDVSYGTVGTLRLGSLLISNIPVLIVEDKALQFRLFGLHPVFESEGVIGMSLLRHFRMEYDFSAGNLILTPAGSGPVSGGIPLFSTGFELFVSASCEDSGSLPFRIDTGSNQSSLSSFGLKESGLEGRATTKIDYVAGAEGWGASLREVSGVRLSLGNYRIGDLRLPVMPLAGGRGFEVAGVLGVDLLRHFRMTIDPYLMTLSLEKVQ